MTAYALATIVAVVGFIAAEYRKSLIGIWIMKPLASTGFLLVAWAGGAMESSYGQMVLLALILGWFGDVFLIPQSDSFFKLGLVSFFLGHVAFCIAFVMAGLNQNWMMAAFPVVLASGFFLARWLLPQVASDMRIPVAAYMVVITVMVVLAAGATGATGFYRILIGAVIFYLSDISVARDKFVAPGFMNKVWGLPFYYGAQLILAMTVSDFLG